MGDHYIDVSIGEAGRHRAESGCAEARPRAAALLELLSSLQSGLEDAARAGDLAGVRSATAARAAACAALAELDPELHHEAAMNEGRHSAGRRSATPGGTRPWASAPTAGRHAAERRALRQPVSRSGRHRADPEWVDPDLVGQAPVDAEQPPGEFERPGSGYTDAVRRASIAALLKRARAYETPVSALRSSPVGVGRGAPVAALATGGSDDEVAERWAAEHWAPVRQSEGQWSSGLDRASEPVGDEEDGARPDGWHPVPRPRHSADGRSMTGGPAVPAPRLAG